MMTGALPRVATARCRSRAERRPRAAGGRCHRLRAGGRCAPGRWLAALLAVLLLLALPAGGRAQGIEPPAAVAALLLTRAALADAEAAVVEIARRRAPRDLLFLCVIEERSCLEVSGGVDALPGQLRARSVGSHAPDPARTSLESLALTVEQGLNPKFAGYWMRMHGDPNVRVTAQDHALDLIVVAGDLALLSGDGRRLSVRETGVTDGCFGPSVREVRLPEGAEARLVLLAPAPAAPYSTRATTVIGRVLGARQLGQVLAACPDQTTDVPAIVLAGGACRFDPSGEPGPVPVCRQAGAAPPRMDLAPAPGPRSVLPAPRPGPTGPGMAGSAAGPGPTGQAPPASAPTAAGPSAVTGPSPVAGQVPPAAASVAGQAPALPALPAAPAGTAPSVAAAPVPAVRPTAPASSSVTTVQPGAGPPAGGRSAPAPAASPAAGVPVAASPPASPAPSAPVAAPPAAQTPPVPSAPAPAPALPARPPVAGSATLALRTVERGDGAVRVTLDWTGGPAEAIVRGPPGAAQPEMRMSDRGHVTLVVGADRAGRWRLFLRPLGTAGACPGGLALDGTLSVSGARILAGQAGRFVVRAGGCPDDGLPVYLTEFEVAP